MRSPTRTMAATVLGFEAMLVFFAGLVARSLGDGGPTSSMVLFGAVALACVVVSGLLRYAVGYALGWVLQVAVVATGFVVPMMFAVGVLFSALWFVALRTGRRIERERDLVAAALAAPDATPS